MRKYLPPQATCYQGMPPAIPADVDLVAALEKHVGVISL